LTSSLSSKAGPLVWVYFLGGWSSAKTQTRDHKIYI